MKSSKVFFPAALTALLLVPVLLLNAQTPRGWFAAGSKPADYRMETVAGVSCEGKKCGHMKSLSPVIDGFGTYMQMIGTEKYAGKRVRMTARLKTKNVQGWAGMWMRVDDRQRSDKSLAFDNMQNRSLKGTADWTLCSIVLDVAADSGALAFGFILEGTGEIWFDAVKFEVVDASVPVTDMMEGTAHDLPADPLNLDFEE